MKLISLKLLHFRRFRQEEIFFEEDFCLLFGKNGAGKSSLLDAIGYALFGPGSKDFVRLNTPYLRSFFLTGREPSKVELQFQYNTETYRVIRVIDAGVKKLENDFIPENKDSLFGPSGLQIIGGTEVSNYISGLLGVSREVFLRSVFTKQKDLEVLSGSKEERKNLIHTILGIDAIERAIGDLKKIPRENKIKIEHIQKELSSYDENLTKQEEKDLEIQLNTQTNLLQQAQVAFEGIKQSFELTQKLQKSLQEKKDFFFKLKNSLSLNEKGNESTQKQILETTQELQKIEGFKVKLAQEAQVIQEEEQLRAQLESQKQKFTLFQELQKSKEALNLATTKLTQVTEKMQSLDVKTLLSTQKTLEERLIEENKNFQTKFGESSQVKTLKDMLLKEGEALKKELGDIQELGALGQCPTCHQSLEKHLPILIQGYQTKLEEKRKLYQDAHLKHQASLKEVTVMQEIIEGIQKQLKTIQESIKTFELLDKDAKNIQEHILDLEKKMAENVGVEYQPLVHQKLKLEYESIRVRLQSYQEMIGIIKSEPLLGERLKSLEEKKESLKLEHIEISQKILELDYQESVFLACQKAFEEAQKLLLEHQQKFQVQREAVLHAQYALKKIQETKASMLAKSLQIKALQEEILLQESLVKILGDYISYLLDSLKPQLEDMASEYFSLITNGKYTQITLDEDYNLMIDQKNIELYSGGEKDLANVCLRLALGQNLTSQKGNPIHFLILDEILGSQDKERQFQILLNLKKLEKKFSQIILISHDEEIKDIASHLIEVKSISNEESIIITHGK